MKRQFCLSQKSGLLKAIKIGVFCGGSSSERTISLKSGRAVRNALQNKGYRVVFVDPANPAHRKKKWRQVAVAFLALHGKGGEDGVIQRLLARDKIPYTGSGPQASYWAFDKKKSKKIFERNSIPTPAYRILNARNWRHQLKTFPAPFFVKPVADGSSVGVFCVDDIAKSQAQIRRAIAKYREVIAETRIYGREVTVGILGKKPLAIIELKPKRDFYDYKAKYTKGMTEYVVPAQIPKDLAQKLQRLALRVHQRLGLRDISRVDMMVDQAGRPYVLEANSIPGMTEFSLVPKAARACGIPFEEVCETLLCLSLKRTGKVDHG